MFKISIIFLSIFIICIVHSAPQKPDDVEVNEDQANEAEIDYKFTLEDGHERQQQRKEVDGSQIVIGFYKYVDPDGKERQIYYKADKKGYHVSYDKPFDFPSEISDSESERLSSAYLPPKVENLIKDVLSTSYLPPDSPSNSYLPPN
ncbi:hypothetical protein PVAND_001423 [Polypedilum vanderplanki]|uniref:Cuticle protein n=1 Tax=Polypedilum vanderplanki TaxID=319348 RepID=A0A9J6BP72_POLVA|nr:hypothetical protein PVAND_001423 [Polypedilum vanderplanki]